MIDELIATERVRDAREAAALMRALGVERVRLTQHRSRAWVIKDRETMLRVLASVEPSTSAEIAIEGITRASTLPALRALITSSAKVIFIAGNGATLRVWPERDEAFIDQLAVDRSSAFDRFRDAVSDTWINAIVSAPAVPALVRDFVAELDQPEVEVDLELALDAALALALAYPEAELEWTAGVVIQLPHGTALTYRKAPIPEAAAADWRASITAALGRVRRVET